LSESYLHKIQDNKLIIHQIVRSSRRTISLNINSEAQLIVRAPHRVSLKDIEKLVLEKKAWIISNQAKVQDRMDKKPDRKYETGEFFLYLGEMLRLVVSDKINKTYREGEKLFIPEAHTNAKKMLIIRWYQQEAARLIQERVKVWSAIMDIPCNKITINMAKSRWASCSQKANLNFTARLIMAPLEVIDYVVVHELSHVHHKNHGVLFWKLVSTQFPDYSLHRRWLKEHSPRMVFE